METGDKVEDDQPIGRRFRVIRRMEDDDSRSGIGRIYGDQRRLSTYYYVSLSKLFILAYNIPQIF